MNYFILYTTSALVLMVYLMPAQFICNCQLDYVWTSSRIPNSL